MDKIKDVYMNMLSGSNVIKEEREVKTPEMSDDFKGTFDEMITALVEKEIEDKAKRQYVANQYHTINKMANDKGHAAYKLADDAREYLKEKSDEMNELVQSAGEIFTKIPQGQSLYNEMLEAFAKKDNGAKYNVARKVARRMNKLTLDELKTLDDYEKEMNKAIAVLVKRK